MQHLTLSNVARLASTLWEALLGSALTLDQEPPIAARSRGQIAIIHISGGWSGTVLIDCDNELARRAAGIMFSSTPALVGESEMQDAVAEITNMLGGHIKALLELPCSLSLPSIIQGQDFTARIPGSRVLFSAHLRHQTNRFTITVLQRTSTAAKAA